jgi:hypothetical protein
MGSSTHSIESSSRVVSSSICNSINSSTSTTTQQGQRALYPHYCRMWVARGVHGVCWATALGPLASTGGVTSCALHGGGLEGLAVAAAVIESQHQLELTVVLCASCARHCDSCGRTQWWCRSRTSRRRSLQPALPICLHNHMLYVGRYGVTCHPTATITLALMFRWALGNPLHQKGLSGVPLTVQWRGGY